MKIYTCDPFSIALPPQHSFPMPKYRLLRERIAAAGIAGAEDVLVPPAATDEEILAVHTPDVPSQTRKRRAVASGDPAHRPALVAGAGGAGPALGGRHHRGLPRGP